MHSLKNTDVTSNYKRMLNGHFQIHVSREQLTARDHVTRARRHV